MVYIVFVFVYHLCFLLRLAWIFAFGCCISSMFGFCCALLFVCFLVIVVCLVFVFVFFGVCVVVLALLFIYFY